MMIVCMDNQTVKNLFPSSVIVSSPVSTVDVSCTSLHLASVMLKNLLSTCAACVLLC